MRNFLTLFLAAGLAANGITMLAAPEYWYHLIPTVPFTGAFNPHFVRDIGCAYLTCGIAFLWFWRNPERERSAALLAGVFLGLHALLHVWDFIAARETLEHIVADIPAVFLLPVLALWLAWPRKANV